MGTRGRSLGGIQGLLPGSVSKYCLQHSPVPVIVVRPTSKREKKKRKRQADPSRRGYLDILQRSGGEAGLGGSSHSSFTEETMVAPEVEAEAVAAAVGLPPDAISSAELASKHEARSTKSGATTPEDPRSPGVVMKSPNPGHLESPALSDSEPSEEEEEVDDDDADDADDGRGIVVGPSSMVQPHDETDEARARPSRPESAIPSQDTTQAGPPPS